MGDYFSAEEYIMLDNENFPLSLLHLTVESPIFPCDRRCRCGSLNVSETGESTKCPWVGVVEGTAGGKKIGRL